MRSTVGWLNVMIVGALCLNAQGLGQGNKPVRTPLPTLRLRIFPDAMYPPELRLPPGEYYLRVDNFATTGAVPIQIDNAKDNRPAQRLVNGNINAKQTRWNQTIQLERGEYVIDAVRHPNWKVRLIVDPAYILPAVR